MTEAARYNAATSGTKIGCTVYNYDDANRLTSQMQLDGSNAELVPYTFTYDVARRLTSEERASAVTPYTYDQNSQLTNDDRNDNRTMADHEVAANNRLATDGTWD